MYYPAVTEGGGGGSAEDLGFKAPCWSPKTLFNGPIGLYKGYWDNGKENGN